MNNAGKWTSYAAPPVPAVPAAKEGLAPNKKKVEEPKPEFRQGTLFKFDVTSKNSDVPKRMEVILPGGHPCMCKRAFASVTALLSQQKFCPTY